MLLSKNDPRIGKCHFKGCVLKYLGERIYLSSSYRKLWRGYKCIYQIFIYLGEPTGEAIESLALCNVGAGGLEFWTIADLSQEQRWGPERDSAVVP